MIENEIIKKFNQGKTIEELADEYGEMDCMAEDFACEYPSMCDESGGYCQDCWISKIKEIVSKKQNSICAGEDGICMICMVGDDLEDPDKCPYDNLRGNNDCPKFQCSEQCRQCPVNCEFLDK